MGNKNLFVNVLGKYPCVISILFFFIIEKEEKDCHLHRLMSRKCAFLLTCIIRMLKTFVCKCENHGFVQVKQEIK